MTTDVEAAERDRVLQEMRTLGSTIGASEADLPTIWNPKYAPDIWWIEVHSHPEHFVYSLFYEERGLRRQLAESKNKDDVLETVFVSVTQSLASHYEARHRRPGEDSRRQWFDLQIDLMNRLRPEWAQRLRAHQLSVLQTFPFVDRS